MTKLIQISDSLFEDLRPLIIEARQDVARTVNSSLVILYWKVGQRIRQDILKEKRADYGEQIVATLSQQLTEECAVLNGGVSEPCARKSRACSSNELHKFPGFTTTSPETEKQYLANRTQKRYNRTRNEYNA